MVRSYKCKTLRRSYTDVTLCHAMKMVSSGDLSKRQAMMKFRIPRSTMALRLKHPGVMPISLGRFKRVFSDEFEKELVDYTNDVQNRFYGLTINDLQSLAFQFAKSNNIDHHFSEEQKLATTDWVRSFLKRNQLTLRRPEPTSMSRLTGFNRVHQVSRFYDNLKEELGKHGYQANQIYNIDETGITSVQTPRKVISRRGCKQVGRVVSAERGITTTIVCAMNGSGNFVPPMIIFKRKLMSDHLMRGAPPGAVGVPSASGWIDRDIFVKYLHHFAQHVKPSVSSRVLIVFDGHVSHKSLEAIRLAKEHGITLLTLPPHTSHRLQPLDVNNRTSSWKRQIADSEDSPMKTCSRNKASRHASDLEIQSARPTQHKVKKTANVRLESASNAERSDRQKDKKSQQNTTTTSNIPVKKPQLNTATTSKIPVTKPQQDKATASKVHVNRIEKPVVKGKVGT